MIIYIADRFGKVLDTCSSELPNNSSLLYDHITDDLQSGVRVFECTLTASDSLREHTTPGHYILAYNTPFTIITSSYKTSDNTISVYAEDAGLDFINKIVGTSAETSRTFRQWVEWCLGTETDSGWKYNINLPNSSKTLEYTAEATAQERLLDILANYDAEMYFTYNINGFKWVDRTINFVQKRGRSDKTYQMRIDKEVLSIVKTEDISQLATVWKLYGKDKKPLANLSGYSTIARDYQKTHKYHIDGSSLICTDAVEQWKTSLNHTGYITQVVTTDYETAKDCVDYALREMEKIVEPIFTYEVTFTYLPEDVQCGDYVEILDDVDDILLKARVLSWSRSVSDGIDEATLGDFVTLQGSKKDISNVTSSITPEQIQEIVDVATESATNSIQPSLDSLNGELDRVNNAVGSVSEELDRDLTWVQQELNTKVTTNNLQQYVDYSTEGVLNVKDGTSQNNMVINSEGISLYSGATKATEITNSSMKSPNAEIQILKMGPYVLEYMYGDDTITLK